MADGGAMVMMSVQVPFQRVNRGAYEEMVVFVTMSILSAKRIRPKRKLCVEEIRICIQFCCYDTRGILDCFG